MKALSSKLRPEKGRKEAFANAKAIVINMDSKIFEKLIEENMKAIFGFALTRLGDVTEAEYLASDILYGLVRAAGNIRDDSRFYGFMWKIAENTYAEYLRKKYRSMGRSVELSDEPADDCGDALDMLIKEEELAMLRRELSLLSKQYREVTVLYYMDGLSCAETAKKLDISTEMVKYYLFRARKIIREGMNMERLFGEKSYRPAGFEIDFWGTKAGDDREYREFSERKIKGNILLAAYYGPVTAQEISVELGVALPYLEDEISLLVSRRYLVCQNGKYLTNIPIFTKECSKAIEDKLNELVKVTADCFEKISDPFGELYESRFESRQLMLWQKALMCMHYSLVDTSEDIDKDYGELPSDGAYSLVNGGGGRGVIWGRSCSNAVDGGQTHEIQGIYNGNLSHDGRGSVIAINFAQTLNAQHFMGNMTDPIVAAACGGFEYLPYSWRSRLEELGYTKNGKPNFTVWERGEYEELRSILDEGISLLTELNREASRIAASVAADLAPTHIKAQAEYVGALVYRFNAADKLIYALCESGFLKPVENSDKPAVCVVKN